MGVKKGEELLYQSHYLLIGDITSCYKNLGRGSNNIIVQYNFNGKIAKECIYNYYKESGCKVLLKMRECGSGVRVEDLYPKHPEYYSKPVLFVHNEEFGNDYYYYAKLRPDLTLNNFGLNKLAIGKDNLLYYKNVNDSIDNQVHQCADSLQSQLNRDMLDTPGAFYFHGEIIPAKQLFSEIPQAKEYYDKYNKN